MPDPVGQPPTPAPQPQPQSPVGIGVSGDPLGEGGIYGAIGSEGAAPLAPPPVEQSWGLPLY